MYGNHFQSPHQHLVLVHADLQCFFLCAWPLKVPVFNPFVQKEKSIAFPDQTLYTIGPLATK